MARRSTPQTFAKRQRELEKAAARRAKLSARVQRNAQSRRAKMQAGADPERSGTTEPPPPTSPKGSNDDDS